MRSTVKTCTSVLLGAAAVVAPVVTATTAQAAANPGQAVLNDYGQSAAEVAAEVASAVNAAPAVLQARQRVTAAHTALLARIKAEKAAHKAFLAAVKSKNAARIAAAKKADKAAHKKTLRAAAAERAAKTALTNQIAATTAAVRAAHYRPVDGTWTGDLKQYFIPEAGLEPIQVRITVYGGHVSDVTVPVYQTQGDSGSYNAMALPILLDRAMAAHDTAVVANVSGASLTSTAFANSLQSALIKAGFHA